MHETHHSRESLTIRQLAECVNLHIPPPLAKNSRVCSAIATLLFIGIAFVSYPASAQSVPTVSIAATSATGTAEGSSATFTVTASQAIPQGGSLSVAYSVSGTTTSTVSDAAEAGDFTTSDNTLQRSSFPGGYVEIQPGQTTATITLAIFNDGAAEAAEAYQVRLNVIHRNPGSTSFSIHHSGQTAVGTIASSTSSPSGLTVSLGPNDRERIESSTALFQLTFTGTAVGTITIPFTLVPVGAGFDANDIEWSNSACGQGLTCFQEFTPNQINTTKRHRLYIEVPIKGDGIAEVAETFYLRLDNSVVINGVTTNRGSTISGESVTYSPTQPRSANLVIPASSEAYKLVVERAGDTSAVEQERSKVLQFRVKIEDSSGTNRALRHPNTYSATLQVKGTATTGKTATDTNADINPLSLSGGTESSRRTYALELDDNNRFRLPFGSTPDHANADPVSASGWLLRFQLNQDTEAESDETFTIEVVSVRALGGRQSRPPFRRGSYTERLPVTLPSLRSAGSDLIETITITSDPPSVALTSELPSVDISKVSLNLEENPGIENANVGTYTIKLGSAPQDARVEITVRSSNEDVVVDTDPATDGNQNTLVFTQENWDTPQSVSVTASQDDDNINDSATITHSITSSDSQLYPESFEIDDVSVTVEDAEPELNVGIGPSLSKLTVNHLNGAVVRVTLEHGTIIASEASLLSNYELVTDIPGLSISSVEQPSSTELRITLAYSGDSRLNAPQTIVVKVKSAVHTGSNDLTSNPITVNTAAVVVSEESLELNESPGNTEANEDSYTVVLGSQPQDNAIVISVISDNSDVVIDTNTTENGNQNTLTFTSSNWNTPQSVSVTARPDDDNINDSATIAHRIVTGDREFYTDNLNIDSVAVSVIDDFSTAIQLTGLEISQGTLAPRFAGSVLNYTATVSFDVSRLTVTPTVSNSFIRIIQVNDATVASGSASGNIALNLGLNRILVVVEAENGNSVTYMISVTRNESEGTAQLLDEIDNSIVVDLAKEITAGTIVAVSSRIAAVSGGGSGTMPTNSGLTSILQRLTNYERNKDLNNTNVSLERALDGAQFAYSVDSNPGLSKLSASDPDGYSEGGISLWGQANYLDISGGNTSTVNWDGSLFSIHVGTDILLNSQTLAGLAVGVTKGTIDYSNAGSQNSGGQLKSRMTVLSPYMSWSTSDKSNLWATVGFGRGRIDYDDDSHGRFSNKTEMMQLITGGTYELRKISDEGGSRSATINLKGEAWSSRHTLKRSTVRAEKSKIGIYGLRFAVEGVQEINCGQDACLTPAGEVGVRWDEGDGDTGFGTEIVGGMKYENLLSGLSTNASARYLLAHESNRKMWGVEFSVRRTPVSDSAGLVYSSLLTLGITDSRTDSFWERSSSTRSLGDVEATSRIDAQVGYGLYGVNGLVTPYVGLGIGESARAYRTGTKFSTDSALDLRLEFEHRNSDTRSSDNRVVLEGAFDW